MRENKVGIDRTSPSKPVSTVQPRETNDASVQKAWKEKITATTNAGIMLSDAQAKLMQLGTNDINVECVGALKTAIRNDELRMGTGRIVDSLVRGTQNYLQNK